MENSNNYDDNIDLSSTTTIKVRDHRLKDPSIIESISDFMYEVASDMSLNEFAYDAILSIITMGGTFVAGAAANYVYNEYIA